MIAWISRRRSRQITRYIPRTAMTNSNKPEATTTDATMGPPSVIAKPLAPWQIL
jgi:hypothetical protein